MQVEDTLVALQVAAATTHPRVSLLPSPNAWVISGRVEDGHLLHLRREAGCAAVQALAASVRERYGDSRPTVAITGSCGKTTTRAMVQLVLAALGPVHATQGNLNNHVGALSEKPRKYNPMRILWTWSMAQLRRTSARTSRQSAHDAHGSKPSPVECSRVAVSRSCMDGFRARADAHIAEAALR